MKPAIAPQPRLADAEPLSAEDLRSLKDALERLLKFEESEWPTLEHYAYVQQLEHLRREITKRISDA